MRRFGDVFVKDRLTASYPVVIERNGRPPSKNIFIDYVRRQIDRTVYSADDIKFAKFVVRQARGGWLK